MLIGYSFQGAGEAGGTARALEGNFLTWQLINKAPGLTPYGQHVAALGGEFFLGDVNELNAPLQKKLVESYWQEPFIHNGQVHIQQADEAHQMQNFTWPGQ
jgi:hypothetical protein